MSQQKRLEERACVVNGAASVIGDAVARRVKAEGAQVVGVDKVEHDAGDVALSADLTDERQVRDIYRQVTDRFGGVDIIYNNMGLQTPKDASALDVSLETWRTVLDSNLTRQ